MPPGAAGQQTPPATATTFFKAHRFSIGVAAILVVGSIVHRPALDGPLALDDYAQRAMIDGTQTNHRGPFNLYDFVDDSNRDDLMARGALPWWADRELTIKFLRPTASALVWLDHRLCGYRPAVPHVLSLLWWAAAVIAGGLLYRRILPARAALVATAVFALSSCHTVPLVWLANRNVLVAVVFGTLGLWSYVEWRKHQRPAAAVGTGALFLAAFLSGEYSAALLGYVFAIEWVQPAQPVHRRVVGILPAALPAAVVTTIIVFLDYRTRFSGYYQNPFTDFGRYAENAPSNLLSVLGSAWFGFADNWAASSSTVVWGLLLALALFMAFLWIRKRFDAGSRAAGMWLLTGSLLAALPLLAAQPSWRLLAPVLVGAAGIVGLCIDDLASVFSSRRKHWAGLLAGGAALALVYVHLLRAPWDAHSTAKFIVDAEKSYDDRFRFVHEHVQPSTSVVLLLRAYLPPSVLWTPFLLRPKPLDQWFAVGQNPSTVVAIRTGPRSVEVRQEEGPLAPCGRHDVFNTRGFSVGDTVNLPNVRSTILATDTDRCPTHVAFEFGQDLDDKSILWLAESRAGFQEITPPSVGIGLRLTP